ncbi:MAG: hypothetical protein XXXJIFNMEKO3_00137 [Candidatus Erwinia impunctatus]|nr:hypothetical protein XXXJIFNMEKO_00137 [Culicoides impunctatus]
MTHQPNQTPGDSGAESALLTISRYLKKQHVLSLCCGMPLWCANCFYVFDTQRVAFWLMSDPKTRHGQQMMSYREVAGTINGQPKSVMMIKGVQYRGRVKLLSGEAETHAKSAYIRRFPVAALHQAALWEIVIDELKMTDNRLGFAQKTNWIRL